MLRCLQYFVQSHREVLLIHAELIFDGGVRSNVQLSARFSPN
jgi:hypothetical protein